MKFRPDHLQHIAAAKAGFSERTARRIETHPHLVPQPNAVRTRQGPDPFDGLWDSEIPPLLETHPGLRPVAVLEETCAAALRVGLPLADGIQSHDGGRHHGTAIKKDTKILHGNGAASAMDYVMPDPQFIWGVSGWLEAASLAHSAGIEMSSHLSTEVSSHLLCAAPTAHWLEHMDVAAQLRREPYPLKDGMISPPVRPGIGLEWDHASVARHRVT